MKTVQLQLQTSTINWQCGCISFFFYLPVGKKLGCIQLPKINSLSKIQYVILVCKIANKTESG